MFVQYPTHGYKLSADVEEPGLEVFADGVKDKNKAFCSDPKLGCVTIGPPISSSLK